MYPFTSLNSTNYDCIIYKNRQYNKFIYYSKEKMKSFLRGCIIKKNKMILHGVRNNPFKS